MRFPKSNGQKKANPDDLTLPNRGLKPSVPMDSFSVLHKAEYFSYMGLSITGHLKM